MKINTIYINNLIQTDNRKHMGTLTDKSEIKNKEIKNLAKVTRNVKTNLHNYFTILKQKNTKTLPLPKSLLWFYKFGVSMISVFFSILGSVSSCQIILYL